MQPLIGKSALITGATSGIGREIAKVFAEHGASIIVLGTNGVRGDAVLAELEAKRVAPSQKFMKELLDVADKKAVDEVCSKVLSLIGNIDILVNNAGITRDALLMKMKEEDWDSVIDTNLKSVFNFCQALVRPMLKAKKGKIINISSVVGLTGNAGQVNYAASKAGMIGLTKALALELATRGICVNCIAPGFIQTAMTDVLNESQREWIAQKIPMGRLGTPTDIANAALFLAGPDSDYMTGQVLTVDGGMVM